MIIPPTFLRMNEMLPQGLFFTKINLYGGSSAPLLCRRFGPRWRPWSLAVLSDKEKLCFGSLISPLTGTLGVCFCPVDSSFPRSAVVRAPVLSFPPSPRRSSFPRHPPSARTWNRNVGEQDLSRVLVLEGARCLPSRSRRPRAPTGSCSSLQGRITAEFAAGYIAWREPNLVCLPDQAYY